MSDATMQAVLLKGHGGFEQLEFRDDVPIPVPAPGEVLIRVGAAGVNNTDINTRTGWYSRAVSEGTTAEAGAAGSWRWARVWLRQEAQDHGHRKPEEWKGDQEILGIRRSVHNVSFGPGGQEFK